MTFKQWVDSLGGISKTARHLSIAQSTVWSWYRLERYPSATSQGLISKASNNQVDMADFLQDYLAKREQQQ